MSISKKYNRTYHYPFSPGTTSDDRIAHNYWSDIQQIERIVHTEKLDGENNCLSKYGVFARSHAAPTQSAWTKHLREKWEILKKELGDLEFFGENLYAIHSIEYQRLEDYYFIFAIRENDYWLSWEEVKFYAAALDFPTVPELKVVYQPVEKQDFEAEILKMVALPSVFGSLDILENKPCTIEGIVSRNADGFLVDDFSKNVFKYVRKGHVKTDQHWARNWKKAELIWQKGGDYVAND
jgi:RNA ligase